MKKLVKAITGGSKAPKIRVPAAEPPPTPMPDEEGLRRAAIREELRKRRTGRASTILTDEEDRL